MTVAVADISAGMSSINSADERASNMYDQTLRAMVDAARKAALGPEWQNTATAWPLMARSYMNKSDYWWDVPNSKRAKARDGAPTIQVELNHNFLAAIMVSKTGKNPVLFVSPDVEVIVLEDRK